MRPPHLRADPALAARPQRAGRGDALQDRAAPDPNGLDADLGLGFGNGTADRRRRSVGAAAERQQQRRGKKRDSSGQRFLRASSSASGRPCRDAPATAPDAGSGALWLSTDREREARGGGLEEQKASTGPSARGTRGDAVQPAAIRSDSPRSRHRPAGPGIRGPDARAAVDLPGTRTREWPRVCGRAVQWSRRPPTPRGRACPIANGSPRCAVPESSASSADGRCAPAPGPP